MAIKTFIQTLKQSLTRRNIYYGLYGLAAMIFFLWAQFPTEYIVSSIISNMQQPGSGVVINVKSSSPTLFPIGIKVKGAEIEYPGIPRFQADYIKVSYGLFPFIGKYYNVTFSAGIAGGEISGKVKLSKTIPGDATVEKLKMSKVNLAGFQEQIASSYPGCIIKGRLESDINYSGDGKGNGDLSITLKDFSVDKQNLLYGLNGLNFTDITVKGAIENKKVQFLNFVLNGREFQGKLEGSMFIREPLGESTLRMTGNMKPDPSLKDKVNPGSPISGMLLMAGQGGAGISFSMTGTLRSPGFAPNF